MCACVSDSDEDEVLLINSILVDLASVPDIVSDTDDDITPDANYAPPDFPPLPQFSSSGPVMISHSVDLSGCTKTTLRHIVERLMEHDQSLLPIVNHYVGVDVAEYGEVMNLQGVSVPAYRKSHVIRQMAVAVQEENLDVMPSVSADTARDERVRAGQAAKDAAKEATDMLQNLKDRLESHPTMYKLKLSEAIANPGLAARDVAVKSGVTEALNWFRSWEKKHYDTGMEEDCGTQIGLRYNRKAYSRTVTLITGATSALMHMKHSVTAAGGCGTDVSNCRNLIRDVVRLLVQSTLYDPKDRFGFLQLLKDVYESIQVAWTLKTTAQHLLSYHQDDRNKLLGFRSNAKKENRTRTARKRVQETSNRFQRPAPSLPPPPLLATLPRPRSHHCNESVGHANQIDGGSALTDASPCVPVPEVYIHHAPVDTQPYGVPHLPAPAVPVPMTTPTVWSTSALPLPGPSDIMWYNGYYYGMWRASLSMMPSLPSQPSSSERRAEE